MNRKVLLLILVIIILTATLLIIFLPRTLVVPDGYPTIQAAIDSARAGDTVFVKKGIYSENVIIDKSLSLIGEESKTTVIEGIPYSRYGPQFVIRVSADEVTISGFTIMGNSVVGIWVENIGSIHQPSGCRIIGNNIVNNTEGIRSFGGDKLIISENNITGNTEYGIYPNSSNSTISGNNISGNLWAGIIIDSCNNVIISGNSITGNGGNEPDSIGGLSIRWDGPFYVYGNNITDNQGVGIEFGYGCNNSTVYENNIERNRIGINLLNYVLGENATLGSGNIVYRNNLVENAQQVFVEKAYRYAGNFEDYTWINGTDTISWGNSEEGNYWSDYLWRYPHAAEIDASGIGNIFYVIDTDNVDHYPFMQPVDVSTASPLPATPFSDLQIVAVVVALIVIIAALLLAYGIRRKVAKSPPPV